jgi:hypothetical protein
MRIKSIEFLINKVNVKMSEMVMHFQFRQRFSLPIKQKNGWKSFSLSFIVLEAFIEMKLAIPSIV